MFVFQQKLGMIKLVRSIKRRDFTCPTSMRASSCNSLILLVRLLFACACSGDVGADEKVAEKRDHRHHVAHDQGLSPDGGAQLCITRRQGSNAKAHDEHELENLNHSKERFPGCRYTNGRGRIVTVYQHMYNRVQKYW